MPRRRQGAYLTESAPNIRDWGTTDHVIIAACGLRLADPRGNLQPSSCSADDLRLHARIVHRCVLVLACGVPNAAARHVPL